MPERVIPYDTQTHRQAFDPMSSLDPFNANMNAFSQRLTAMRRIVDKAEEAYLRDPAIYNDDQLRQFQQLSAQFRNKPFADIGGEIVVDDFFKGAANDLLFNLPQIISGGRFGPGDSPAERQAYKYGGYAGLAAGLFTGGKLVGSAIKGLASRGVPKTLASAMTSSAAGAGGASLFALVNEEGEFQDMSKVGSSAAVGAIGGGIAGGVFGKVGGNRLIAKAAEKSSSPSKLFGRFFRKSDEPIESAMESVTKPTIYKGETESATGTLERLTESIENNAMAPKSVDKIISDHVRIIKSGVEPHPNQQMLAERAYLSKQMRMDAGNAAFRDRLNTTNAVGRVGNESAELADQFSADLAAYGFAPRVPKGKGFRAPNAVERQDFKNNLETMLNSMPDDEVMVFHDQLNLRKQLAEATSGRERNEIMMKIRAAEGRGATPESPTRFIQRKVQEFEDVVPKEVMDVAADVVPQVNTLTNVLVDAAKNAPAGQQKFIEKFAASKNAKRGLARIVAKAEENADPAAIAKLEEMIRTDPEKAIRLINKAGKTTNIESALGEIFTTGADDAASGVASTAATKVDDTGLEKLGKLKSTEVDPTLGT